jgi:hypothetical protein
MYPGVNEKTPLPGRTDLEGTTMLPTALESELPGDSRLARSE